MNRRQSVLGHASFWPTLRRQLARLERDGKIRERDGVPGVGYLRCPEVVPGGEEEAEAKSLTLRRQ